jgi:peptide/nickel transport system permease protein
MAIVKGNSPTRRALKRLFRNRSAVVGMAVIAISVVMAVLGYLITPDSTPNSNDQVLQVNNKPPGFKVMMLEVRKNREVLEVGFFRKMISGQPNPYELIPMNEYRFDGADIVYHEFTGNAAASGEKRLPLAEVVYATSQAKANLKVDGDKVTFIDLHEKPVSTTVAELQKTVKEQHIGFRKYLLGTDLYGRDILSRVIIGVRISLSVGLVAVLISMSIGIFLGALAGYFRGWIDDVIMWLINVVWSIPTILLVFAMTMAFDVQDRKIWQLFVAIGITMWVDAARIVRGQVMSAREIQFVEAAKSLGYTHARTIFLHILPNILGPLIVVSAANFASAILIEAGLSFLGIGVESTTPTWGRMLSENYGYIISSNIFLALVPGIAIMMMVLAFNLLGNGLRDAMDVKTSLQGK